MRYVAGLIPAKSRVLPEYFKGDNRREEVNKPVRSGVLWLLGILFSLAALAVLYHPLLSLPLALAALVLIPPGARFLESQLQCRLTAGVKAMAAAVLLAVSLPLMSHYVAADNAEAYKQELLQKKEAQEKVIADQKDRVRKDSLNFYIQQGSQLRKDGNSKEATACLLYAWKFAALPDEQSRIQQVEREVKTDEASALFKAGSYADALLKINSLLTEDSENGGLLYARAVCYSKTGKVEEAIGELKQLKETGSSKAAALYDKLNPIRRRISGYCTRCWDGSISYATGRGACSHHGGVKNWNDPIYEEYRKYE